jgi:tRNA pseudouridine38-40 synthase
LTSLAEIWLGTHDFAAFGTPPRPGGRTIRTVKSARWQQQDDEWLFEIQADAFLYRMVRRLVYAQVAVGQARLSAITLARALDDWLDVRQAAQSQIPAGLAPASGLTLVEVLYDN